VSAAAERVRAQNITYSLLQVPEHDNNRAGSVAIELQLVSQKRVNIQVVSVDIFLEMIFTCFFFFLKQENTARKTF